LLMQKESLPTRTNLLKFTDMCLFKKTAQRGGCLQKKKQLTS
jgi:hypothetical protein